MSNIKSIILNDGFSTFEFVWSEVLIIAIISMVITIGLYRLRSFGLYTLAKKQGLKKTWLSFIPFLWIFIPAKLIGTIVIGRKAYKNFATFATIFFALNEIIALTITILVNFPLVGYYLQGGEVYIANTEIYNESLKAMGFSQYIFSSTIFVRGIIYPYSNLALVGTILSILSFVSNILSIVSIVVTILVYVGLFRKFWPQRHVLATVLSVLGFFPIMVFVIRKKNAVSFSEYMRSRYYGHGFNRYGGSFTNGNNYGATSGNAQTNVKEPESPFEEFEKDNQQDDPFDLNNK